MNSLKKTEPPAVKNDKRQIIIDAASEAFLENGYQNASMESISCKAGVAKQTLYNYFGNKDALFIAVVDQKCDYRGNETMRSSDIKSENVEEVLRIYAQSKLADLVSPENTAMFRMMISEAIRFPNLGEMFFKAGLEKDRLLLVDFLTLQNQAGNLKVDDPEQAALFFQGALNAYFRPKFIMTNEMPSKEAIQQYIDYCIEKFLLLYQATP
ncbi:TetR/AcrR family transcriptional regulator [Marinospirillum insulare]|uniref:TetR family transcriptional regulator n=1 Tax=Marinospirillum insulare TaxID=217169 RepID=A0ABQ5ZUF6_9GAMM|nr:TetR/AcrR family transcriptional regulator [Marinospirillum insulare]GLR63789.1 TetR family transcriptional regulator [Marinospirillum insulare]